MRTSQAKPNASGRSTRFVVLSLVSLTALVAVGYAAVRTYRMLEEGPPSSDAADSSRPAVGRPGPDQHQPGVASDRRATSDRPGGGARLDLAARGGEARQRSVRGARPASEESLFQRILPNGWRPQAPAEQAMSEPEDREAAERQEQLETEQAARLLLHDPDPTERSEGIAAIADLDEETARRALEGVLRESEPDADVRWETYDKLMDLAETEDERIRVGISALADRLSPVRDQAAYYLSTEDADAHPELLPAMRRALATEADPDTRSSIESALESLDPEFVPAWQLEDAEDEITAVQ